MKKNEFDEELRTDFQNLIDKIEEHISERKISDMDLGETLTEEYIDSLVTITGYMYIVHYLEIMKEEML